MNELKNPFGLQNSKVILIGDLAKDPARYRGKKCGCICPFCHAPFLARIGERNQPHFSHSGEPCPREALVMTSLYLLLQQAITHDHAFFTPAYYAAFDSLHQGMRFSCDPFPRNLHWERVFPPIVFSVSSVVLHRNRQNIPDALILEEARSGHQLAVIVVPPKNLCKSSEPLQFQNFSTVSVNLSFDFESEEIDSAAFQKSVSEHRLPLRWVRGEKLTEQQMKFLSKKGLHPLKPTITVHPRPGVFQEYIVNFSRSTYQKGNPLPSEPLYDSLGLRWYICEKCLEPQMESGMIPGSIHGNFALCRSCGKL